MTFQSFQSLYQHIKLKDIKLFETLDKISDYLKSIIESKDPTLAWINLSLGATYVSRSTSSYLPASSLDTNNNIHLAGVLRTTNYVDTAIVSTTHLRPTKQADLCVFVSDVTAGTFLVGILVISANGQMTVFSKAVAGHTVDIFLDGLVFRG